MSTEEKSDVVFCLKWESERPYIDKPQQSSYFRVFGEEWYLKIFLENHDEETYYCSVRLCQRDTDKPLTAEISASCNVIAQDFAFQDVVPRRQTIRVAGDVIFQCYPPIDPISSVPYWKNWIIYCHLSCVKFVAFQINTETIYLSTVDTKALRPSTRNQCIQTSMEIQADLEALSKDMYNLFLDQVLPDFELKCNGQTFPVHKSVLAARSEVFRQMFQTEMQESQSGFDDIKDLGVPVLEALLKYIYSGKAYDVLSEDTAANLYEAADRYIVHSLFATCSQWMERNLTEDNCPFYLFSADSHSDENLKSAAQSFILAHPVVLTSPAWIYISKQRPALANDVLQAFATLKLKQASNFVEPAVENNNNIFYTT